MESSLESRYPPEAVIQLIGKAFKKVAQNPDVIKGILDSFMDNNPAEAQEKITKAAPIFEECRQGISEEDQKQIDDFGEKVGEFLKLVPVALEEFITSDKEQSSSLEKDEETYHT